MYKIKIPKLSDYHLTEEIVIKYKEKIKKAGKKAEIIHNTLYGLLLLCFYGFLFFIGFRVGFVEGWFMGIFQGLVCAFTIDIMIIFSTQVSGRFPPIFDAEGRPLGVFLIETIGSALESLYKSTINHKSIDPLLEKYGLKNDKMGKKILQYYQDLDKLNLQYPQLKKYEYDIVRYNESLLEEVYDCFIKTINLIETCPKTSNKLEQNNNYYQFEQHCLFKDTYNSVSDAEEAYNSTNKNLNYLSYIVTSIKSLNIKPKMHNVYFIIGTNNLTAWEKYAIKHLPWMPKNYPRFRHHSDRYYGTVINKLK